MREGVRAAVDVLHMAAQLKPTFDTPLVGAGSQVGDTAVLRPHEAVLPAPRHVRVETPPLQRHTCTPTQQR